MAGRRLRRGLGGGLPDDDDDDDLDGTFEDLVPDDRTADRQGSVEIPREDLPIEVDSLPIPAPYQGLQRAAIVFNLNFVWDTDEEEWIRDEGNGGGGGVFTSVASGTLTGIPDNGTDFEATGVTGQDKYIMCVGRVINGLSDFFILAEGSRGDTSDGIMTNAAWKWDGATNEWFARVENESGQPVDVEYQLLEADPP